MPVGMVRYSHSTLMSRATEKNLLKQISCYLRRFVSVSVKNQYQLGTVLKILSAPLKVEHIWPAVQKNLSVLLSVLMSMVQKGFSVPLNAMKIGYF